jgi:hypothetical protein
MHETTVHTAEVVLQRVSSEGSGNLMVHPPAFDTVLQYFLVVGVSCKIVRPLVPTPEHPW